MKSILTLSLFFLSVTFSYSQILDKNYNYILESAKSPDAKIIKRNDTEIIINWFNKIPCKYIFDKNGRMLIFLTQTSKNSAEMDESIMVESGLYKLEKIEFVGYNPCRIYNRGFEYSGFYYFDNSCYQVTAYSIELVLETIRLLVIKNSSNKK